MTAFVSPGVYTVEEDLSQYAARISTAILGLVGCATKGPVNQYVLITNEAELINTFGRPKVDTNDPSNLLKNTPMILAAMEYLTQGNQLLVVRVANSDQEATTNIDDGSTPTPNNIILCTAVSTGSWANGVTIRVSDVIDRTDFSLSVIVNGLVVEKYTNLSTASNDTNPITGLSTFIETVINDVSKYITVSVLDTSNDPDEDDFVLSGGLDGLTATPADFIGVDSPSKTGMQIFENSEVIDINLLAVPGVSDISVWLAMASLCESRADCLAILDTQYGLSVQGVNDFADATGTWTSRGTAINSSYVAVYWPWVQIYDPYNKTKTWAPPSGFVASRMAYTDRVANSFRAPAGTDRGRLLRVQDVETDADHGSREFLGAPGRVVNPIVNFAREGVTIWGQRTAQRTSSALDRVNVRRMMLFARKVIATTLRVLVFEPNDEQTWRRFIGLVSPVFDYIKAARGVIDFQVICDESTNPPEQIDNNILGGRILIKPTKTAEKIEVTFTLIPQGAEFQEFTEA